MRVLVACEFSGVVRDAFAARGHEAWSCDLLQTEKPGNHLQCDVLTILEDHWDLMIAHPPCTFLSRAAGRWLYNTERLVKTQKAFDLIKALWVAPINRICIENPPGWLCTNWKMPFQRIHPWYFGDGQMKQTCLWLKNLPKLQGSEEVARSPALHHPVPSKTRMGRDKKVKNTYFVTRIRSAHERARTFPGIAEAMASQWGRLNRL
jgi:hypothetical protein